MAHRKTERDPLFAGRWFEDDIILLCLRWYFRFKLSYRDLVEILGERGLPDFAHHNLAVGRSLCRNLRKALEPIRTGRWVGVGGLMKRLSRCCGASGCTCIEPWTDRATLWSYFSVGHVASQRLKAFFRKALKHHRELHSITLDGHRPSPSALRRMGMNGEFNFRGRNPVKIRCCQYLNNVVEQDHRRGERAIALDVGIQDVLQCATCHYRHRAGAEDSQTPVRNSDPMAVESRGDLASRHGSIGHFAAAHSWSYRSDNPICTRTGG